MVSGAFRGQFAFGRFNGGSWRKKKIKLCMEKKYTADGLRAQPKNDDKFKSSPPQNHEG